MATPHASFQDFSCSDGSGNPKTVWGLGAKSRPSAICRRMESAAAGWVNLTPAAGLQGRCGAGGFAGLSLNSGGGRVACRCRCRGRGGVMVGPPSTHGASG